MGSTIMEFTVESFDPPAKGASIARPSSAEESEASAKPGVAVLTVDLVLRFCNFVAGFFRSEKSESESLLSLKQ
jgi:hypothetical protein